MIPFRLELPIHLLTTIGPSKEHTLLEIYTGDNLSESDAKRLWAKITDHKWYISERLSRDVGIHVAAVDYVENFYDRSVDADSELPLIRAISNLAGRIKSAAAKYFEARSTPASV